MFGLLKPKSSLVGAAPANGPGYKADVAFQERCIAKAFESLVTYGRFQGAFLDLPAFECRTMPDGIEIAVSPDTGTTAVLAERVAAISQVGARPLHWSHVAMRTYCLDRFGAAPEWINKDRALFASIALAPSVEVSLRAEECHQIDPTWEGQRKSGATLYLQVKQVA